MCGIVGFITKERYKAVHERQKFMDQALLLDQLRGDDATGVFYGTHGNQLRPEGCGYFKQAAEGSVFLQTDEYREIMRNTTDYRFVVGHNRFATHGTAHKVDNAHPFREGPLTLVHNGGLHSMVDLPVPPHSLHRDVQVDSHVIAHNLALHSVDEVVAELQGAFVLVWYDDRDKGLHIIRNNKRPLAMAEDKDSETIYFASEAGMLAYIANRNNIKLSTMYEPKEGRMLSFYSDDGLKPRVRDVKLHTFGGNGRVAMGAAPFGLGSWQEYMASEEEDGEDTADITRARAHQNKEVASAVVPFHQSSASANGNVSNVRPMQHVSEQVTVAVSPNVIIASRLQPLPIIAKEILEEYGLVPTQVLAFVPNCAQMLSEDGSTWGAVFGEVETGEQAYVTNVPVRCLSHMVDEEWLVAPVLVLESGSEDDDEPTIMCKVVRYMVPAHYVYVPKSTSLTPRTPRKHNDWPDELSDEEWAAMQDAKDRTDERDFQLSSPPPHSRGESITLLDKALASVKWLKGPNKTLLTSDEWGDATATGCEGCGTLPLPAEHEQLVWLDTGLHVCQKCDIDVSRTGTYLN